MGKYFDYLTDMTLRCDLFACFYEYYLLIIKMLAVIFAYNFLLSLIDFRRWSNLQRQHDTSAMIFMSKKSFLNNFPGNSYKICALSESK
jgi:hypothetical protein